MNTKRMIYILVFVLAIWLSMFIVISFAKYSKKIEVAELQVDVVAPEYWNEVVGSGFTNGTFAIITNTERTLVFEAMGTRRSKRKNKNTC